MDEKGENKQQGLGVSQSRAVLSTNTISKTNVSVKNKTGTVTTENKLEMHIIKPLILLLD